MKILETPICIFCEEEEDDINHALFECPVSRLTWNNMQLILNKINIPISLDKRTILFGCEKGIKYRHVINSILLETKNTVISPRSNERHLSVRHIIRMFSRQHKIEVTADHIRDKKKLKMLAERRWGNLIRKLEAIEE